MKKFFLLLIFMAVFPMAMMAYDVEVNGIYYNLDTTAKTATVTFKDGGYNSYSGNVEIPASIEDNGIIYTVTQIHSYAFFFCRNLTSIDIPNSVTSIGDNAFYACTSLTSINIPEGVTNIGVNAFNQCTSLTSIDISNSVTTIGRDAFYGCTGLTSITIPVGVTSIGERAFYSCSGLTSITVASGNDKYDSRDNCNAIIETSTNTLITGCNNTIIPNSVTSIGAIAFVNCTGLTSITIPVGVTSIGNNAFYSCSGLTSITVAPDNNIYDSRDNCNAIIETSTNTLITGCKNTIIPNSVTSIRAEAFAGCSGLTSITIPDGVTSIGFPAFAGCSGLTSITVAPDNNIYDSRDNCNAIIETSTNTLKTGCKNTIIPNSVTSIMASAFHGCTGLTSITIPVGVTSIEIYAFYECTGLTSVTVENPTPVSITSSTFTNCANATLYVPRGSLSAYQYAKYWKEFKEIIEIDNRQEQTLSYSEIPTKTYGDAAFTLPQMTTEGLTITWTSSDTNVATISGNTLTVSGAGTATITATQEGNDDYKPFIKDYTLTVNKAPLTVTAMSYTIMQGDALPSFEVIYDGFKNNDDETVLTSAPIISCEAANTDTEGTYPITVSGAASDCYEISYVDGTLTVAPNKVVITITAAGMGTYCSPSDLDFSTVTDLKAYIITGYDWQSKRVYATRVYDVPAGTGIYLVGAAADYTVPISSSTSYYINMLVGTLSDTEIEPTDGEYTNLRLTGTSPSNASFKFLEASRIIPANKAYLQIPTNVLGNSANAVGIIFDDETDGIESIEQNIDGNNDWFTLDGRKINGMPTTKGVYVVKGRKVVIK